MHSFLKTIPVVAGLLFAMTAAGSEVTQAVDAEAAAATVAAASKTEETDGTDTADVKDGGEETREEDKFKVPAGFRVKTRGKYTLYCRSESVMGTNFKSEKCYDETGIRELVRAQRENKTKMDQMRAICGQTGSCGGGT